MAGFFTGLFQWLINALGAALIWLIDLFPDSPFSAPSTPPDAVNLGWITWLLDFPTWIAHLTVILSCFLSYYSVKVAARWLKMVRS